MRYFIELAYKGTNYHGWQIQPHSVSVQGVIQKALQTLTRRNIVLTGAGRTDAGVHALQMYAHFDMENDWKDREQELLRRLNAFLPDDIVIYNLFEVSPDAHARYDALERSYEYRVQLGKNPFNTEFAWQIFSAFPDLDRMNRAAELLLQEDDFKAFSRTGTDVRTYICDVRKAEWEQRGNLFVFHISADRFLRNMVRAVVGTLVDVGRGNTSIDGFREIIHSRDRSRAGASAPAQGLFLNRVQYDFEAIRKVRPHPD